MIGLLFIAFEAGVLVGVLTMCFFQAGKD